MVEATADTTEDGDAPKKGGKGGLLVALVGALVAGGGGFAATYVGVFDSLLGGGDHAAAPYASEKDYSFVPLDPIIISLGPQARAANLKFTAQLEVTPQATETVVELTPRILDVLNGYLRAVDEAELQDPAALSLLRAQMLRRIQIVTGEGMVRDLLVTEFILN